MNDTNKIIKKESDKIALNNDEELMKKILIKEMKDKLKNKIVSNDPAFMKTLKYMLNDMYRKENLE
ncbi:MAG: hypothetical protein EPN82_00480 [Bacteroidetes bacterium]|nr:MAG: hypothetical protein EPN82_00480 [Bacteroidota bacterium]